MDKSKLKHITSILKGHNKGKVSVIVNDSKDLYLFKKYLADYQCIYIEDFSIKEVLKKIQKETYYVFFPVWDIHKHHLHKHCTLNVRKMGYRVHVSDLLYSKGLADNSTLSFWATCVFK